MAQIISVGQNRYANCYTESIKRFCSTSRLPEKFNIFGFDNATQPTTNLLISISNSCTAIRKPALAYLNFKGHPEGKLHRGMCPVSRPSIVGLDVRTTTTETAYGSHSRNSLPKVSYCFVAPRVNFTLKMLEFKWTNCLIEIKSFSSNLKETIHKL